ncbi:chorismate synthase [bacterium endosymbiont of Pedicinus badii]|uniref:chorismate synthase n=1 Tax=bacterium endosymbiont of Pedicinus badii TaxID=1719126 RepID=UPI0009BB534C|nr:chorismate synthase [bacterium endosymbiont of Pedicinus badii]OQM34467.1 chorismate synthase [bacterium endosymbiont of Pedicinus badii]
MPGNSIGKLFKVTTFGESHGSLIGAVIDGMPPKFSISEKYIQKEINRRKSGFSEYTTKRIEEDKIKIVSGIFKGQTTGASIGIFIKNKNFKSKDYQKYKNIYRPGHADFSYKNKYGIRDYRGGGRASARETVIRVAAGSIAKKYLFEKCGIKISSYVSKIGRLQCRIKNSYQIKDIENVKIANLLEKIQKSKNSIGSKITVCIKNVPIGLGEPIFDKLDADLSHAIMTINAVKGVEVGDGFSVVEQKGDKNRDPISKSGFLSNHSGGIIGGISTGQKIILHAAIKPTSSIEIPIDTVDEKNRKKTIIVKGRHDTCLGIRAMPIVESMVSIVLMDHYLRNISQCHEIFFKKLKVF